MRVEAGCIFCRIAAGEISSERVYEDEHIIVFRDLHPQAPTHLLVIPREHIPALDQLRPDDGTIAAAMMRAASSVAREAGLTDRGYRVIMNAGSWGGQTVLHLHMHVLGGRQLGALG